MNNLILAEQIRALQGEIEAIELDNEQGLEFINNLAKECNRLIKEVKAEHKEEIAKYHQLHKLAKAKEKADLEPLENAQAILKQAIGDYMKRREAILLETKKQQEEEEAMFGVAITETQQANLGGTHVRKTWKARIIDENIVPTHYMKKCIRPVDEKAINEIAKYSEGTAKIDGIEFYQEELLVVR